MYFLIKCQKFYVFSDKKIKNINNAKCSAKFKSGCFEAEIIDSSHSEKTLQIKCRKFNDDLDAVELTEQFPEVTRPDSTKVEALLDSVELTEQCPQVTRGGSTKVEALLDKRNGDRTKTRTVDVAGSKTIVSFVKDVCASNKLNEDRGTVDVAGSQTGFSFGNSLPNFEKDVGASNKLNEDRGAVDEDGSETGVSFVNESTPYFKNNIGIQTDNQCNDPEAENETDSESSQIQGDPFEDSGSEYQESKTESESENVITPIKRRSRSPFGKTRRVRWTNEERFDITLALGDVMSLEKLPSLQECNNIIKRSNYLKSRTPAQLKTWIDNQRKAAARKGAK